jgi:hypothetical protein
VASLWSKIRGTIETAFQIGLGGPQLKNNSGAIDVRNSGDSAYAIVRGATPLANNDLATKAYVDQNSKPFPVGLQFNGNNPLPSNSSTEQFYVVSTTGANATIGQILWDDGSNTGTVTVLAALSGRLIGTTASLSGGTVTFLADALYMWDSGASTWFNVSASASSGSTREIRLPITNAASQSSASQIPANAYVVDARLSITTPYSGGATISLGYSGSTTAFMLTTDNLATVAGIYQVEQDTSVGGSPVALLVTVGGSPAAGAGAAIIQYTVPNA